MTGAWEELGFSREVVDRVTKAIKGAIGEFKEFTSDTDAIRGKGFEELSMTAKEAGGEQIADAFEDFCEKWEWGMRGLISDANGIADRLDLAAGYHFEEDQYRALAFKKSLNAASLGGNPHASDEELLEQGAMDIAMPDAPDYSAESFERAEKDIKGSWDGAQEEVTGNEDGVFRRGQDWYEQRGGN